MLNSRTTLMISAQPKLDDCCSCSYNSYVPGPTMTTRRQQQAERKCMSNVRLKDVNGPRLFPQPGSVRYPYDTQASAGGGGLVMINLSPQTANVPRLLQINIHLHSYCQHKCCEIKCFLNKMFLPRARRRAHRRQHEYSVNATNQRSNKENLCLSNLRISNGSFFCCCCPSCYFSQLFYISNNKLLQIAQVNVVEGFLFQRYLKSRLRPGGHIRPVELFNAARELAEMTLISIKLWDRCILCIFFYVFSDSFQYRAKHPGGASLVCLEFWL